MKLSREIKAAILVISSILLFIWGYSFLKGKDILESYKTLYVYYDTVEGLAPSALVTFNGMAIGKVSAIAYDDAQHKILVTLQIKGSLPIAKSSVAVMYEPGFIGGKQIMIVPNFADNQMIEDKSFMQGEIKPGFTSEISQKIIPLQQKLEHLISNADSLIVALNKVLDEKSQRDIKESLSHFNTAMAEVADMTKTVNGFVSRNEQSFQKSTQNLEKISGNMAKLSDSLSKIEFSKTVKSLEQTLATTQSMLTDIQQGKGSLGKLFKDEGLYNHLEGTARELEQLLADMKRNPKRYVHFSLFGRKAEPYKEEIKSTDKTN